MNKHGDLKENVTPCEACHRTASLVITPEGSALCEPCNQNRREKAESTRIRKTAEAHEPKFPNNHY